MGDELKSIFDYHDLIAAIVAALEARDIYTLNHSVRVSNMSDRICQLIGLSKNETEIIHIAADLHDIGKIGIPDNVLLKEGSLTETEWNTMKSHPNIGFSILNKVERFDEIAKIVRHHHERYDGLGYPDRISGTEIPLGSRIIAIADSIDAMLSNRSYRKGLSSMQCKAEIRKNVGKMYDSSIAEIVLDNWDDILAYQKTFC